MSEMIDRVDGISSAPPIPIAARAVISIATDPEKAAHADPAPKTARPAMKVFFRPTLSATLPAVSSRPANTMT